MPHPGLPHHWAIPGQAVASSEQDDRQSTRERHGRSSRFRTRSAAPDQPRNPPTTEARNTLLRAPAQASKSSQPHPQTPATSQLQELAHLTEDSAQVSKGGQPPERQTISPETTQSIQPTPHPQPDTPVEPRNQQLRGPQPQFFSRGVEVPISPAGPATPRHESWQNDAGCGHRPRSPSYRRPAGWPG